MKRHLPVLCFFVSNFLLLSPASFSSSRDSLASSSKIIRSSYLPLQNQHLWSLQLFKDHSCAASLFLPPSRSDFCEPWFYHVERTPFLTETMLWVGGAENSILGFQLPQTKPRITITVDGHVVAPIVREYRTDVLFAATTTGEIISFNELGNVFWRTKVDAEVTTPIISDQQSTIFMITANDTLYALDSRTGAAKWIFKHSLPSGLTLKGQAKPLLFYTMHQGILTQAIASGFADGQIVILNAYSGEIMREWTLSSSDSLADIDADIVPIKNWVAAASAHGDLALLDPVTGQSIWNLSLPGVVRLWSATTVENQAPILIALTTSQALAYDALHGNLLWTYNFEHSVPSRLSQQGSVLYWTTDKGGLYAVDLYQGTPLLRLGDPEGSLGQPITQGTLVMVYSSNGTLHGYQIHKGSLVHGNL